MKTYILLDFADLIGYFNWEWVISVEGASLIFWGERGHLFR